MNIFFLDLINALSAYALCDKHCVVSNFVFFTIKNITNCRYLYLENDFGINTIAVLRSS